MTVKKKEKNIECTFCGQEMSGKVITDMLKRMGLGSLAKVFNRADRLSKK